MKYWEYRVLRLSDHNWEKQATALNTAGAQGWRLVAVFDGVAYMEREYEASFAEQRNGATGRAEAHAELDFSGI
jgi:hypothetical protein